MPGLDPQVVMHRRNIKPDAKPIKQQQWQFWPDIIEAIETEVHKFIECDFIREEQHLVGLPTLSVLKKNEKIRVCIDFHDLNAGCQKDEFLLPITDVMIDNNVASKGCPSWMTFQDTIKLICTWMMKSTRHSERHWGYTITQKYPFGLKNAGATYQRAMSIIFCDHLRKTVECYVNDIAAKSRSKSNHLDDLRTVFNIYGLTNWRWTRPNHSWGCRVASSLDS